MRATIIHKTAFSLAGLFLILFVAMIGWLHSTSAASASSFTKQGIGKAYLPVVLNLFPEGTLEPTSTPTSTQPVPTPTPTPTEQPGERPQDGDWAGTTSRGYPVSFTVLDSGTKWQMFRLKTDFIATTCYNATGTVEITNNGPGPISGNHMDYSMSTYGWSGDFDSTTFSRGTFAFNNHHIIVGIPYPPYICHYYLTQSGSWTANKWP